MKKTCPQCHTEKPHTAFPLKMSSPDGRHSTCRTCRDTPPEGRCWHEGYGTPCQREQWAGGRKLGLCEKHERQADKFLATQDDERVWKRHVTKGA